MDFQGTITKVLPLQEGTSKKTGKPWAKIEILVKESNPRNEDYPDIIKVEQFKQEDHIKWIKEEWSHKEGDEVELQGLSFKTSEWKEKYYTNISVFKIEKIEGMSGGGTQTPGASAIDPNVDLPFISHGFGLHWM